MILLYLLAEICYIHWVIQQLFISLNTNFQIVKLTSSAQLSQTIEGTLIKIRFAWSSHQSSRKEGSRAPKRPIFLTYIFGQLFMCRMQLRRFPMRNRGPSWFFEAFFTAMLDFWKKRKSGVILKIYKLETQKTTFSHYSNLRNVVPSFIFTEIM